MRGIVTAYAAGFACKQWAPGYPGTVPGPTLGRPPSPEEHAADADVGRAPLAPDRVVLRRPHRELGEPVLARELAQPAEPRPRHLRVVRGRWHRREAAHV